MVEGGAYLYSYFSKGLLHSWFTQTNFFAMPTVFTVSVIDSTMLLRDTDQSCSKHPTKYYFAKLEHVEKI